MAHPSFGHGHQFSGLTGETTPVASAGGLLKGLSYYMNGAAQIATAADLARETGVVQISRFQIPPAAFTSDTNGIKGRIDNYLAAGIACIYCPWDDAIDVGGLTQAAYASHCADVANRFPTLLGIEVCNEVNYHYSAAKYALILEASYTAIKAAQPSMKVCFCNLDKVDWAASNSYFAVLDSHGVAVVRNNCDAVGFHGYKLLGLWDHDAGPTRKYDTSNPWSEGVNAKEVGALLNDWFNSFHAAYGNINPRDASGKLFWCTEIGFKWLDATSAPTVTQHSSTPGPPAGTYFYWIQPTSTSSGAAPRLYSPGTALGQVAGFVSDGVHGVQVTWPATINTGGVGGWDVWRLGTNNPKDLWDPVTADGAPYDLGPGKQFGYVGHLVNGGTSNTLIDNLASCGTPPSTYDGVNGPRGLASGDAPYDEGFVAAQIGKVISEYRRVCRTGDVVAWYLGRSSFSNPSRGVYDPNWQDLSRLVQNDGTLTSIWSAFAAA